MKIILASVAALALTAPAMAAAPPSSSIFSSVRTDDVLTRMFVWWNAAFKQSEGFTPQAFGQYFTDDAVMRIDGTVRAQGLDALAKRFRMIQGRASKVEIKIPFVTSFSSPDGSKIFTSHVIDSVDGGKAAHELVMGYATIRGGKIAMIDFVSGTLPEGVTPK